MTTPVTKSDLNQAVSDIKEHVNLIVTPVKSAIETHDTILRGVSKKNGLVGDVNKIKTTHTHVKWAVGGGLAGLASFVKSLLSW